MKELTKILTKVYKWARQNSEPPACCINQAEKEIIALMSPSVEWVEEVIRESMEIFVFEDGAIGEGADYKGLATAIVEKWREKNGANIQD